MNWNIVDVAGSAEWRRRTAVECPHQFGLGSVGADMAQFDLRHWWNLVAAAGAVIAVIFFAAQLNHGFLLGLGLLLVGVGERINHPVRSEMERPDLAGYITTERMSWKPNGVGLSLDFFGIALVVISLFLAVFAP